MANPLGAARCSESLYLKAGADKTRLQQENVTEE